MLGSSLSRPHLQLVQLVQLVVVVVVVVVQTHNRMVPPPRSKPASATSTKPRRCCPQPWLPMASRPRAMALFLVGRS
jgi:hypothetical protein